MSNFSLKAYKLGKISLKGEKTCDLPMWSINFFIQELCNNYSKLLIIQRICELSQSSIERGCFFAAKQSAALFPKAAISKSLKHNNSHYIILSKAEDDSQKFWHVIESYTRPAVFFHYNENDETIPLYDFTYSEAIKINKLTYNSPINIDAKGAIDGLIDLALAKSKYEMAKDEYEAKQINQLTKNYNDIARAGQTINDPKTPEWIRHYANYGLIQLLEKQGKLNEKLGIKLEKVDERA